MIFLINGVSIDIPVSDDSYRLREIMSIEQLSIHIELTEEIEFPIGTTCEYDGKLYKMYRKPTSKRVHSRCIEYFLTMYSEAFQMTQCAFRHTIGEGGDGRLSFSLTATPKEHLQMVVDCLNRELVSIQQLWSIGGCIGWDGINDNGIEKLISYDFGYCKDALDLIAEAFETEYHVEGKKIYLGKVEFLKDNPLLISYGENNGISSGATCNIEGDALPLERVFIQGGEQNIDLSKYGNQTLLLPKNGVIWYDGVNFYQDVDGQPAHGLTLGNAKRYIVSDDRRSITRSGKRTITNDGFFDATEIYPSREGVVSAVEIENAKSNFVNIYDNDIPSILNYEECLISGETLSITFQSGVLAGREFDVEYVHSTKCFKIVPAELDGVWMPGGNPETNYNEQTNSYMLNQAYMPAVGDKYIVSNCQLPEAYFDDGNLNGAEWDMFREAVKYLYDNEEEKYSLSGIEIDSIWAKRNWESVSKYLNIGCYFQYSDKSIEEPILVRVTSIRDYINNPYNIQLTLTNALVKTSIGNTIRRSRRLNPGGGFDPRQQLERDKLWNRTSRGFNGTNILFQATENYLQQCRNAVLDIRNAIADSSNWEALKQTIYRDSDTGYVYGVRTIGDSGTEICKIEKEIAICTEPIIDINNKLRR